MNLRQGASRSASSHAWTASSDNVGVTEYVVLRNLVEVGTVPGTDLQAVIEGLGPGPVILVTHDWGAYIGYLYEKKYPARVKTMIAMDVGGHFQPATIRDGAMFVGYQWTLVTLWLVGGLVPPLGTWLTHSSRSGGLRSFRSSPHSSRRAT